MMLRLRSRIPLLLLSLVAFVLACVLSAALNTSVAIAQDKVAVDEISQAVGVPENVTLPISDSSSEPSSRYGMVDPIAPQFEVGYQMYLESCATCHVALPPAVLPADTWQALLTDTAHYGLILPELPPFNQQLVLNYLLTYSRRHRPGNALPYRLKDSRYFDALHPNVDLPQPLNLRSCVSCHQGASAQNYSATGISP
ncbi:MAG: diheme cytochrome C [Cyanobacteria bacterium J06632_3]